MNGTVNDTVDGPVDGPVAGAVSAGGHQARRRPTGVTHLAQLPEPGSFVTADAAGSPLLLVRQDDGFAGAGRAGLGLAEHPSALAGNLVWVVPDRSAVPEVAVPPGIAGAALVRAATFETRLPWAQAEARASADAAPIAPGSDPGEAARVREQDRARREERVARLRAVWP